LLETLRYRVAVTSGEYDAWMRVLTKRVFREYYDFHRRSAVPPAPAVPCEE
ncbi:hypothetical protein HK405_014089, partial [Cladochytrium tenue]